MWLGGVDEQGGVNACRHLEAPDRFRAIQTYRAAMAIMAQQRQFILRLYNSGMLTEAERELMEDVRPCATSKCTCI